MTVAGMRVVLAAVIAWAGAAASAVAQETDDASALAGVYACAPIADSSERLACYDAAVAGLRQAENSGNVVVIDREGAETVQRESFGFNMPSISRLIPDLSDAPSGISHVEAQIARIQSLADGRHRFVLDNGQTWVQIEAGALRGLSAGDAVVVRRASLGSYMLVPSDGGRMRRVRRED